MEKENSTAKIKYNVFEGDLIIPKLKEGEVGINLGCGGMYIYGWTNCDKKDYEGSISFETDETFDLDVFPYPLPSDNAEYIILHHVIEHLENPIKCINECYRMLKPGGKLIMHYPHYTSPMAYQPTHLRFLGKNCFNPGNILFQNIKTKLLVSQFRKMKLLNKFINWIGNRYEKSIICYFFPAYEVQWEGIK